MTTHSEHTHHILPLKLYLSVGTALLALTVLTVVVARMELGVFNTILAMVIAVTKASLVALFFMHLKYDSRLYTVVFLGSLAFLGLFIILSMADTETRGEIDPIREHPIVRDAVIYRDGSRATGQGAVLSDTLSTTNAGDSAGASDDSVATQSSETTPPEGN